MPNRGSRSTTADRQEFCKARDGANCRVCGTQPPAWPKRLTLDHINGNKKDNRPANWRLLCARCQGFLGALKQHNRNEYDRVKSSDKAIRELLGVPTLNGGTHVGVPPQNISHNGHEKVGGYLPSRGDIYTHTQKPKETGIAAEGDKQLYDNMILAFWDQAEQYLAEHGGKAEARALRENSAIRVLRKTGMVIKPQTQRAYLDWACCEEGPFMVDPSNERFVVMREHEPSPTYMNGNGASRARQRPGKGERRS